MWVICRLIKIKVTWIGCWVWNLFGDFGFALLAKKSHLIFFWRISGMQSQLVCSGCRSVLLYPRGATNVCCALCNTITSVPIPGMFCCSVCPCARMLCTLLSFLNFPSACLNTRMLDGLKNWIWIFIFFGYYVCLESCGFHSLFSTLMGCVLAGFGERYLFWQQCHSFWSFLQYLVSD